MKTTLLEKLVCPKCKVTLLCTVGRETDGDILEADLKCSGCDRHYPVTNGIPRFVETDDYATSFGYQWNKFRKEQIDSFNGTTLSADRFWSETKWTPEMMKNKWILDAGCGAGRFLDIASLSEAEIVGIDISSAIDAARSNLEGRSNVHFVQASIYELPFREGAFDLCYSIGVIQHTPDTSESLRSVGRMVKAGGQFATTIYPRKPWTKLYSKYWFRPFTTRMKKEMLLDLIEKIMPVAFSITNFLFRLPGVIGRGFMFIIPVANYVNEKQLTERDRYQWAILDTFDMLSPYYDQPMTEAEASSALDEVGVKVKRTGQSGLNLIGKRV
ncbi:MAG: methyltransferase domain-containing protein [Chloracidobacterium sp.]|nr:methyltransferase domain-containing protein [Chloracidobacterium sp.]